MGCAAAGVCRPRRQGGRAGQAPWGAAGAAAQPHGGAPRWALHCCTIAVVSELWFLLAAFCRAGPHVPASHRASRAHPEPRPTEMPVQPTSSQRPVRHALQAQRSRLTGAESCCARWAQLESPDSLLTHCVLLSNTCRHLAAGVRLHDAAPAGGGHRCSTGALPAGAADAAAAAGSQGAAVGAAIGGLGWSAGSRGVR